MNKPSHRMNHAGVSVDPVVLLSKSTAQDQIENCRQLFDRMMKAGRNVQAVPGGETGRD